MQTRGRSPWLASERRRMMVAMNTAPRRMKRAPTGQGGRMTNPTVKRLFPACDVPEPDAATDVAGSKQTAVSVYRQAPETRPIRSSKASSSRYIVDGDDAGAISVNQLFSVLREQNGCPR